MRIAFISILNLLILSELVSFSQFGLPLWCLRGEESLPSRAEVDVPPPKAPQQRVGFLVVVRTELAVFAIMCHNDI